MTVKPATPSQAQTMLDWAAAEGWNPGLDDAAAFFAADPQGFFVKLVDGAPVAAVSVVNHSDDFAFLGLYLCLPAYRGRGYGIEVWQAGMAHAGSRCVGLDGVPAQQANYAKSGYRPFGKTVRFGGRVSLPAPFAGRVATARDLPLLQAADAQANGIARPRFCAQWFTNTPTRETVFSGTAFATLRRCHEGIKIGPLLADTREQVQDLLARSAYWTDGPVFIDVPDSTPHLAEWLTHAGFVPGFETARMYTATPPVQQAPRFHAIATMELG